VVIALAAFISAAQTPQCQPGEVLGVEHGRDYVLNICDAGRVALRGVEPPLRTATVIGFRNEGGVTLTGGELLGDRDVGPEAIAFLSAAVIQRGLGYADRRGSHPRRDEFIALEAAARRSKVGVWAS
jgi:hypothetical protein